MCVCVCVFNTWTMGGFPSHDAAGFLYTTAVQHPNNGGSVEICLVPLLRRYFNDNNKKLKDAITRIYFKGPPNTSRTVMQQQQHGNVSHGTTPPVTPPAAGTITPTGENLSHVSSTAVSRDERKHHAAQAYRSMEHLLGEIEASLFSNTRIMYECAEAVEQKLRKMDELREARKRTHNVEFLDAVSTRSKDRDPSVADDAAILTATGSQRGDGHGDGVFVVAAAGDGINIEEDATPAGKPATPSPAKMERDISHSQLPAALQRHIPQHLKHESAQCPLMRPIPCAICIMEPEAVSRGKGGGGGGNSIPPGAPHMVNGLHITDWANVQGRKLHCIGYLSLFSSDSINPRHTQQQNTDVRHAATPISTTHLGGSTVPLTPSVMVGATTVAPTVNIPRQTECPADGYDVYLELVLENEDKFRYLIEPVLFLASMTFRSQFMTCSMWNRPTANKEVEEIYCNHLRLLNIHVLLGKDRYHQLKSFFEQLPLIELVDEMGVADKVVLRSGSSRHTKNEENSVSLLNSASDPGTLLAQQSTLPKVNGDSMDIREAAAAMLEALEKEMEDDGGMPHVDGTKPAEAETKKNASGNPLLNSETSGLTTTVTTMDGTMTDREGSPGRRCRRTRRRQRKNRQTLEQDEIYRTRTCQMPSFSLYELHTGESGIEAVFDGDLLARLMKFVTETAAFETVKGNYVRCDLGPLMKERRHLMQSYREALEDYLDLDEEAERLLGSEITASCYKAWLKVGTEAEEKRQAALLAAQKAATATPTLASTTAAAPTQHMMMYVPGVGYVTSPQMVLPQATTAPPMPQPQYFLNPATGQMMMAAPRPIAGQQQYIMATAPQIMQQIFYPGGAAATHQAPQPQSQSAAVSYQYVMGPNGQVVPIPVAAGPQPQVVMHPYSMYHPQLHAAQQSVTVGMQGGIQVTSQQHAVAIAAAQQAAAHQIAAQQQQQRSSSQSMSHNSLPVSTSPPQQQHPTSSAVDPKVPMMKIGGHMLPFPMQASAPSHLTAASFQQQMMQLHQNAQLQQHVQQQQQQQQTAQMQLQAQIHAQLRTQQHAAAAIAAAQQQQQMGTSSAVAASAQPSPLVLTPAQVTTSTVPSHVQQPPCSPPNDINSSPFTYEEFDDEDTARALAAATAAMAALDHRPGSGSASEDDGDDWGTPQNGFFFTN